MGKKLSFKQYLESKEKLREAVTTTPQRTAVYRIRKYCKIIVGESKEVKEYVNLKPKQKMLVEWKYEDKEPSVVGIKFSGVKEIDSTDEFETFWPPEKLQKWLDRNANEQN